MDVQYINPFWDALKDMLTNFGIQDVKRGSLQKKETMHVDMDITSVIGLIGDIRGNIAYSMDQDTAKHLASSMMMGMPVTEMDGLTRSAIGEFTNMVTGKALGILSESVSFVDITPPSLIFGKDIFFVISSVETITIDLEASCGKIQINIGLEI